VALVRLWLQENHLVALPKSFGQLKAVQELWLQCNLLNEVPQNFGYLASLRKLRLEGNRLVALPESFGELSHLHELWLQDNKLKSLPENFCQLAALQKVCLRRNELHLHDATIRTLEILGQVAELKEIWVYDNQLAQLPTNFAKKESSDPSPCCLIRVVGFLCSKMVNAASSAKRMRCRRRASRGPTTPELDPLIQRSARHQDVQV